MIFLKILLTCCLFIVVYSSNLLASELNIYFLNIGEGNSTLITTPNSKTILIDSGGLQRQAEFKSFIETKTDQIDHLIFSHPHLDHISGAFALDSNRIINVYDNQETIEDTEPKQIFRWYKQKFREHSGYQGINGLEKLKQVGKLKIKLLSPTADQRFTDWNSNSLVIQLKYYQHRILIMNDANLETEQFLINKYGKKLRSEILLTGHHGNDDASSQEFLATVRPEIAIISTDPYSVPAGAETLNRLKKLGINILNTQAGHIKFSLTKDEYSYTTKNN